MPTFIEIGTNIGALVEKKNKAYGNAFAESCKILEVLFPNGVPVEKYTDLLTITRILDKLFRIATDKDALGESPFGDIAGYAILALKRQQDEVEKTAREMREIRLKMESENGCCHITGKCSDCGKQYTRHANEVGTRAKTGLCDGCYALSLKHTFSRPATLWECTHCKKPYEGSLSDVNLRSGLCPKCEGEAEGGK